MPRRIATTTCALLLAAYAHLLFQQYGRAGGWLVDDKGAAQLTDYVSLWSAGRMVVEGRPAAAYDWKAHAEVMSEALQRSQGEFPFSYPPTYLPVVAVSALIPYVPSMLISGLVMLALYAAAAARIVGTWQGAVWMCAPMTTMINFYAGQNGFLTSALLGGGLALLPARPILAGVLIGALTIKPHLGMMVPLALAAAGCWRAFGAAAATAVVMALGSVALFGVESWAGFMDSMSRFGMAAATTDYVVPAKLQSAFGMLVSLGVPRPLAMGVHIALALAVAGIVVIVWRSAAAFPLKAATLAAASVLASPYVFIYDLTMHGIAAAFLIRHWLDTRLETASLAAMAVALAMTVLFFSTGKPMGFVASVLLLAVVLAECRGALGWRARGRAAAVA